MSEENSIQEIFESILLVFLLIIIIGAGVLYLNPDAPKLKLINYELKNTMDLASGNDIEIKYTLIDNEIEVRKEENKLIVEKNEANYEKNTHSSNSQISQNQNIITITS